MHTVKVGQVWHHTTVERFRRVRVIGIYYEAGIATVENMDTSRVSRIALSHFCPHHHWRLHRQAPPEKPLATEPATL